MNAYDVALTYSVQKTRSKTRRRMCGAPSSDGRLYLRLADGSGWTYDRSAKDVTKVVTCQSHEAEAMMHESRPVQEQIS